MRIFIHSWWKKIRTLSKTNNMQRFSLLFLLFCATLFTACQTNKNSENQANNDSVVGKGTEVIITGEAVSSQKGLLILKKMEDGGLVAIDTAEISGTTFTLKAYLTEPDFYAINVFGQKDIPLALNPANPKVKVSLDTRQPDFGVKVTGSKDTDDYYAFEKIIRDFTTRFQALEQKYTDQPAELQKAYNELQKESVVKVKAFMDSIGPTIVSVRAASVLEPEVEYEFLKAFHQKMKVVLPESKYTQKLQLQVQSIAQELEATKHLQVGQPAPEISLPSPEGSPITLSSLKGKVVLIDFWASWCGPCRQENPNVVRVYNEYKSKGFEIYGVSLDKERDSWLAAIKEDQLSWLHVSDLQFWSSAAAQTYHVRAIPATYLIGRDGIILAKNLRGPALEAKLAEVLEKS